MTTRSRRALVAAAVVAVLITGLFAAAPMLLAIAAKHYLKGTIQVNELEIESVGLGEATIANLRLGDDATAVGARHAVIRYTLWPARIQGIEIQQASVAMDVFASDSPGETAMPVLPDFPVRIDDLQLEVATPWGPSELSASVTWDRTPSGRYEGVVDSADFTATLSGTVGDPQQIRVSDAQNVELLQLSTNAGNAFPLELDGQLDLQATIDWLRHTRLVPTPLRAALTRYEVSSGGVELSGALARNMDFKAVITGDVLLRDQREAANRTFESLTMESGAAGYNLARTGGSWSGSGEAAIAVTVSPGTTITAENPHWRLADGGLTVNAVNPEYRVPALSAESIEINAPELASSHAAGRLSIEGLRMETWPEALKDYRVEGGWTWRNMAVQAEGTGTGEALPALRWSLDVREDGGNAVIRVLDDVAAMEAVLESYTQSVARELNVLQGRVGGAVRFQWDADGQSSSLDVSAGPLDLDLDEMEVRDLSARVTNRGEAVEELDISVRAPTIKLAAGTVTEDLEISMRLKYPLLHIDEAQTRLFSGHFAVRPATLDLNDDEWILFLDISDLSLEAIMALFELESTQLTGRVTGPVRLVVSRSDGLAINEGKLRSVEPGVLKFSMSPDAKTASQLDNLALRALENFQYDELSASVRYGHDGAYRITARIVGHNPNVLDGHPIALNPDIEGQLPALFRAFFITGDFNRALLENIRQQGSMSTPGQTFTLEKD